MPTSRHATYKSSQSINSPRNFRKQVLVKKPHIALYPILDTYDSVSARVLTWELYNPYKIADCGINRGSQEFLGPPTSLFLLFCWVNPFRLSPYCNLPIQNILLVYNDYNCTIYRSVNLSMVQIQYVDKPKSNTP